MVKLHISLTFSHRGIGCRNLRLGYRRQERQIAVEYEGRRCEEGRGSRCLADVGDTDIEDIDSARALGGLSALAELFASLSILIDPGLVAHLGVCGIDGFARDLTEGEISWNGYLGQRIEQSCVV